MNLKEWNLNKNDYKYLIIILIFSLITIFYRTKFHMSGGVFSPDKALYLINALMYSGMDYYHIANTKDIFFAPIISFLTSILFRFGIVDQLAISIVSSIFAIFGYFGMYILLKNRFNSLLSLTGVVIYGSISEFLLNLSSGLLDVPAISISICIVTLSIIAIDKNYKYFIIIFPLLAIGFFTRYTTGFVSPVILMYYIMKRNVFDNILLLKNDKKLFKEKLITYIKSGEFKTILISILFGVILVILITKFLIIDYGGSLTFIQQSYNTIKQSNYSPGSTDFSPDKLFYIKNFSEFLFNEDRSLNSIFSYLIYSILIIGLSIKCISLIKKSFKTITDKITDEKNMVLNIIILLSFIGSIIGFKVFSNHLITNIFLIILMISLNYLINNIYPNHNYAFVIMNIGYILINLVFISLYPIKVLRYALPILPPFIFFVILGLESILNLIKNLLSKNNHEKNTTQKSGKIIKTIPIILILILIISTFTFIEPMKIEGYPNSLVDASKYIISHDPNYHNETFASGNHNYRLVKWNLKENITFVILDPKTADSSNVTYIIDWDKYNLENYHEIYKNDYYHIYHHN